MKSRIIFALGVLAFLIMGCGDQDLINKAKNRIAEQQGLSDYERNYMIHDAFVARLSQPQVCGRYKDRRFIFVQAEDHLLIEGGRYPDEFDYFWVQCTYQNPEAAKKVLANSGHPSQGGGSGLF